MSDAVIRDNDVRRRSELGCVYCGVEPGTTRDHVPPKALFPEPRPPDLVTVPCCEFCRESQSRDDEYFKTMLLMRHDVAKHPAGERLVASVTRALARPQNRRFTDNLLRSVRPIDVRSLAGLYLGPGSTYAVDVRRLDDVVRRTMLGLYFHENGYRLPDDHQRMVFCSEGFSSTPPEIREKFLTLADFASTGSQRTIGNNVFTYWVQRLSDGSDATLWGFLFFLRVAFVGFTGPHQFDART
jgi:hypothetical protein